MFQKCCKYLNVLIGQIHICEPIKFNDGPFESMKFVVSVKINKNYAKSSNEKAIISFL